MLQNSDQLVVVGSKVVNSRCQRTGLIVAVASSLYEFDALVVLVLDIPELLFDGLGSP